MKTKVNISHISLHLDENHVLAPLRIREICGLRLIHSIRSPPQVIQNNGFNPTFGDGKGEKFTFEISTPDAAIVSIQVWDQDNPLDPDDFVGGFACPVPNLRCGIRHVPLLDDHVAHMYKSSVLCKFEIAEGRGSNAYSQVMAASLHSPPLTSILPLRCNYLFHLVIFPCADFNDLIVRIRTIQVSEPSMRREYKNNPMEGGTLLAPFQPPSISAAEAMAADDYENLFSRDAAVRANAHISDPRIQQVDVNQLRKTLGDEPPPVPQRGKARLAGANTQIAKTIEATRQEPVAIDLQSDEGATRPHYDGSFDAALLPRTESGKDYGVAEPAAWA
jgi:hypothetical protein